MSWVNKKIGDLGQVCTGKTPPTANPEYWGDDVPFITPSDLVGGEIDNAVRKIAVKGLERSKEINQDAVLVSCIGYIGKCAIFKGKRAGFNQQINAIIPDKTVVDPYFLLYRLIKSEDLLKNRSRITTVPILNKANFEDIEVPIPPLNEQSAIAQTLKAVQRAKEAREAELALEQERKAALMAHLFTHGTRSESRKQTSIGEIPESWEVKFVEDIYDYTKKPRGLEIPSSKDVPFIPMDLISEASPFITEFNMIPVSEIKSGTYVERGDLLISKITPCFENGKQGVVAEIPTKYAYATTEVIAIKEREGLSDKHFLSYYIRQSSIRHSLAEKMVGTTGRQRLNKDALSRLLIPCPPYKEQKIISDILLKHDFYMNALENEVRFLKELFVAMLDQLMTGKLSVQPLLERSAKKSEAA